MSTLMHSSNMKCSADGAFEINSKPGVVAHTCNPNTRETEVGAGAGHCHLHTESEITSSELYKSLCPLTLNQKQKGRA